jgi:uncharacterized protein with HEPN domain
LRRDIERLKDILDAIDAIERHTEGGREAFDRDELIRVWCLHHLETIGEACARLSESIRNSHDGVPWREIIGMRNVLIHGYFDIDWDQVWNAVQRDVPVLKGQIVKVYEAENE